MDSATFPGRFAEVAVPLPLRRLFTYRVPDALAGSLLPGMRVRVPFGKKARDGYCVRLVPSSPVAAVATW